MHAGRAIEEEPEAVLPVYAVTPFTMLDFPGKAACIVWFSGCNMRCGYCHNPQIVKTRGRGELDKVVDFLERRRGLLDGVVFSGGEATLYPGLLPFAARVKSLGFAVKLDTNGTRPDKVAALLSSGYLDFIALDYKAPAAKFQSITGRIDFASFAKTLDILLAQTRVPFEVRTTVHTGLLQEADINAIIGDLDAKGYRGMYFLQNFRADNNRATLGAMGTQARSLMLANIVKPKNFQLAFRNFEG